MLRPTFDPVLSDVFWHIFEKREINFVLTLTTCVKYVILVLIGM